MQAIAQQMQEGVHDAALLERLYRVDRDGFVRELPHLLSKFPDSGILQAWAARLDYSVKLEVDATQSVAAEGKPPDFPSKSPRLPLVVLVVALSLLAGTLAKIPAFLGGVGEFFYPRDFSFCVLPQLALYFAVVRRGRAGTNLTALVAMAIAAVYINSLPNESLERNAGLALACLHLPSFLGWAVFLVFAGAKWRETAVRTEFVRLVGESVIYTALILITGIILTMVTMGLFSAIRIHIEEFYPQWVVVYGTAAAPVVGTHLAYERFQGKMLVAPLIARLFSPLVLITLAAYLAVAGINFEQLFNDRDSLLVFNIVSWIVLAMVAFILGAWQKPGWLDWVLLALVGLTLLVNVLALAAIIYRIVEYGFSPNRCVLAGWNILMGIQLAVLVRKLPGDVRRGTGMERSRRWLLGYLPVYAVWNTIVLFTAPWW